MTTSTLFEIAVLSSGRWRVRALLGLALGFALGWAVQREVPATNSRSAVPPSGEGEPVRLVPAARQEPRAPPSRRAVVALCVGGLLELTIPQRGQSVADHVLRVLRPDTFVAGTLKGRPNSKRIARALEEVGTLQPFARVSVIKMPTVGVLRRALEDSGHWDDFLRTASGKGSGQLPGQSNDKRKWLPLTTSPVLGNPKGNTLQELHYQSRCIDMIAAFEQEERAGEQCATRNQPVVPRWSSLVAQRRRPRAPGTSA